MRRNNSYEATTSVTPYDKIVSNSELLKKKQLNELLLLGYELLATNSSIHSKATQ